MSQIGVIQCVCVCEPRLNRSVCHGLFDFEREPRQFLPFLVAISSPSPSNRTPYYFAFFLGTVIVVVVVVRPYFLSVCVFFLLCSSFCIMNNIVSVMGADVCIGRRWYIPKTNYDLRCMCRWCVCACTCTYYPPFHFLLHTHDTLPNLPFSTGYVCFFFGSSPLSSPSSTRAYAHCIHLHVFVSFFFSCWRCLCAGVAFTSRAIL